MTTNDPDAVVEATVMRYRRELDRYRKFAQHVGETLLRALPQRGVPSTVQWRAKQPESLRGKLQRNQELILSTDRENILANVRDLAAVRVCTYRHADRLRALEALDELFGIVPGSVDNKDSTRVLRTDHSRWYRATHLQIGIRPENMVPELENLSDDTCEVQISSLLEHSWNEIEHDIGYKPVVKPPPNVRELLNALGRWRQAGDRIIDQLMRADSEFRASLDDLSIMDYEDFVADASARLRDPTGALRLDDDEDALVALHQVLVKAGLTRSGQVWHGARPERYVVAEPMVRMLNDQLARDAGGRAPAAAPLLVSTSPADRLLVVILSAVAPRLATLQDGHYSVLAAAYLALESGP
ncbi:MAG: hypothetical protein WCA46_16085 [Actinocatenispora sp.]